MRSIYTLFCCLVMFLTSSQLSATSFEVVNTGSNMTVFVIPGATMSGDVANVSEIGIFYTNDSGDLVCAGASSFSNDGSPFQITLWGSEAGEDNGMTANEVFTWKAQSADGAEYDVTPSYSVEDSDVYQLNGFTAVNGLAFTATSIEPEPIVGCMDANASNFNVDATEAGFDQWGNSTCVYASCEDIPTWGCIYADGFGTFNADFSAVQCTQYGGSPCEEPSSDVVGCMDSNASNYDSLATVQGYDQYNNLQCVYASCDDIPTWGCIYADGFGSFNADFSAVQCTQYGGSPCEEPSSDVVGCMDSNASNYDSLATVQGYDQYNNLQCVYASCDDIPTWGCIYADGFGTFNADFSAAQCSQYGGSPCEEPVVGTPGCMDANASNFNADATEAGFDQYGNSLCVYASCDDIPEYGCIYGNGFGPFNADFSAAQCSQYGGSPCEEPVVGTPGCMDANASNFNADATEAGFDQYGNSLCVYASCDDIPEYGCIYGNGFGPFNADFSAAQCSEYGGSPCEEPVSCSGTEVIITLTDSYADGGGQLTVGNVVVTNDGASNSVSACLDLATCQSVVYAATDAYPYENSWNITDASGEVLALGANEDGLFGVCLSACTDSTANNFNEDADISDNELCTYDLIQGCTDVAACNFDSAAQQDNGTCELPLDGFDCDGNCISGTLVTVDGGLYPGEKSWTISDCDGTELAIGGAPFSSCVALGDNYSINLVDSYGDGWDGTAMSIGDSSYTVELGATANFIVGSCGVAGCTDDSACNFSADATFDDGSCDVPAEGFDCDGNCISGTLVTVDGGSYPGEKSWTISDCDGTELASGGAPFASCVALGDNYQLNLVDSYGDGWDGTVMTIEDNTYTVEADVANITVGSCSVTGCMDANASNFNVDATEAGFDQWGNSTCVYASCEDIPTWGCIYADGFGTFNADFSAAQCSEYGGSPCEEPSSDVVGCMDSNASNYDSLATVQGYDQYNNLQCVYASCDDIPEYGCIYADGFGSFNADFSAAQCSQYGGSPCEEPVVGTPGCMDANASNFNVDADVAGFDQYGNSLCVYASCDDIPTWGCIYGNGFGPFNADFSAAQCSEYGGSPCEEPVCPPLDFTALNTGSNMTLFITPEAVSADLAVGDMIGVFFTNDVGDLVCAGSSAWTGSSMQVTAYGNDATTDVLDGFSAGEAVVWKAQTSSGVYDVVPTYLNGDGSFTADALLLISSLDYTYSCSGSVITGCTDVTATNYDSNAAEDDGSCIATVVGCMDGHYLEFNPAANVSNQSDCITWKVEGCTDSTATNFDSAANIDDGSCTAIVSGCTDVAACNFDSAAQQDNGTCELPLDGFDCDGNCISGTLVTVDGGLYPGEKSWTISDCDGTELAIGGAPFSSCVALGDNYSINLVDSYGDGWDGTAMSIGDSSYTVELGATANFIVGSCGVAGCTDDSACNFSADATFDDGSCDVPAEGFDCDGNCISGTLVTVDGGSYPGEKSWTISDCDGTELASGGAPFASCVALGDNYQLNLVDSYGDGWDGTVMTIEDNTYTVEADVANITVGSCSVTGCMDANASNFNVDATEAGFDQWGNSTCVYASCEDIPTWGCIYADGFGTFNADFSAAQCSEYGGSPCEEPSSDVVGCMDSNASNYDSLATVQGYDQYNNLQCVYASCDDIPTWGCIYADGFGSFNADFSAVQCTQYGGSPCEEPSSDVVGCMDSNASNYDSLATVQGYDQYNNLQCVYASCDDIPTWGCIYADGFGTFNADFSAAQCSQYGGSPCEEPVVGTPGCMDANASNFNADATEAGFDQYGNSLCVYASCDDIPEYGCIYGNGFGPFNADFSAAQCSDYGGSPCEEPVVAEAAPLFFSEYAEGSSNNKYLEIYNPTSETVDLAGYAFPSVSNAPTTVGVHEYWNAFTEGASIAAGGVYVIAHGSSDPAIIAEADQTHNYLSNGDDGYALAFGSEEDHIILDVIGDFNGDPGSAWDVAGVSGATKDHTLVRKFSVTQGNTDWSASAGTNADDSEWLVFDQNTWTYLGSHEEMSDDIPGCTDELAFNYDANATSDDGSCVAVVSGCTDADASNYNGDANTSDDSCISWADLAASLQSQLAAIVPEDGITQADVDAQADLSYGYGYGDGAASVTPEDGISQADVDSVQALLDAIVPEDGVSQADVDAQADLSYGYGYGDGAASVTPEDGISQADVDSVQALLDAIVPEDGVSQADVDAQADLSYGYGYGDGAASVTPEDGVSQADVDSVEVLLAAALESACSPIFVDIVAGWNILGYTLPVAQDVAATLNSIEANILIVKDNNAEVYWPEFGFNGIGSFIPGQGYQIKTDAAIADYTWPSTDERISMSSSVPQWAVDMEVDVHPNDIKSLVKVVNMLGQEINVEDQFKGEVVLYLYNDGTVEKKIVQ